MSWPSACSGCPGADVRFAFLPEQRQFQRTMRELLARACPHLSPAEASAYDAPYPDTRYKAGVRRFPNLVPEFPDSAGAAIGRAARDFWRNGWRGQSVMAIGMTDPVLGPPVMRALHRDIRGCPPPLEFAEAGHFVQEWGDKIAPAALAALRGEHPAH